MGSNPNMVAAASTPPTHVNFGAGVPQSVPNVPCMTQNAVAAAGQIHHYPHGAVNSGSHSSLRDSMSAACGGSATQLHAIRGSTGTGPIRSSKHRKDTSPYGSDRFSNSNVPAATTGASGNGASGAGSLLNIPESQWRRSKSDPFIVSSLNANGGTSTGVSPAGSVTDTPGALMGSNGAISPLQGASPTVQRRGKTCALNVRFD